MSSITGIVAQVDYSGAADNKARVDALIAAIPDPDTAPANQGVSGFLDQMSPACAAQLRVELAALKAVITNS